MKDELLLRILLRNLALLKTKGSAAPMPRYSLLARGKSSKIASKY